MQAFDYVRAHTVEDVVAQLGAAAGHARVLAGGTDLIVALRERRAAADLVVDVKGVDELDRLAFDPAAGLSIGAAVPCFRIYSDAAICQAYPGLIDAVRLIGGVQIQGRASVGGNLCNASPAADSIPALMVHDALAVVAGAQGRRRVAVQEFCTAPGRTVLRADELLVSLELPPPTVGFGAAYLRFTPRNEMDIAVVGVGAAVQLDGDGRIAAAQIALGAVGPTPLLAPAAAATLIGQLPSTASIDSAARLAQTEARPISDLRGAAAYRRHLVGVLTRRALARALACAEGK